MARSQSLRGRRHEHSPRSLRNMPRHDSIGGTQAWVSRWWRALLSELFATAVLVWLGVSAALPVEEGAPSPPLGNVAAAFGCVIVGCCMAFGAASGAHMNPAVTLAAALGGRLAPLAALGYAVSQLVGAVVGFAALQATMPTPSPAGVTLPAPGVGAVAAAGVEAALTGLLALACLGAWRAEAVGGGSDATVPVKLGLLVAGLVCAGGAPSGASLNPARSFAPALMHCHWQHHWVYWVGPLGGAVLASLLHRVLYPRDAAREDRETVEEFPLDDNKP